MTLNHDTMIRRSGITYRQLDHWTKRGWLKLKSRGSGPGTTRIWSQGEDDVALVLHAFALAGFKPEVAAGMVRSLVGDWGWSEAPITSFGLQIVIEPEALRDAVLAHVTNTRGEHAPMTEESA